MPGRLPVGAGAEADRAEAGPALGPAPATTPAAAGRVVVASLRDALPAWAVSRLLVLAALGIAHLAVGTLRPHDAAAAQRVHEGLLSWDAGWYEAIAAHGYAASGVQSLRFFPGFPMAARALAVVPGVGVGAALVALANAAALAALVALGVLVRRDLGDASLARRSVWLLALAPSAYALVLGYADSSLLLLAVLAFLALRRGRWWWAAALGLGAGLVRPVGALLAVPALVEVVLEHRSSRAAPGRGRAGPGGLGWAGRFAAVAGPLAGAGWYLAWVGAQFGDPWLPLRVQQQQGHRGPLTAPLASMWHNATSVLHGHHVGSALHIPWVVLALVLLVLAYRRLPLSYAAFATVVLAVSLTSSNLDSFERYALGAFPLVVAASTLTARRRVEVAVLLVSGVAMAAYAVAAFVGLVVP